MESIFRLKHIWILPLLVLTLSSCGSFEKEVEIELPEFKPQLAVEAYIENNKAIKVALTETQDYFGDFVWPFVDSATVTITYNGRSYTLKENKFPNLAELKYFNYILNDSFSFQPGDVIYINVIDNKGKSVTAESRWINPVKIDSIKHSWGPDSLALITAHFKDPVVQKNFYRFRVVNKSDSNRVIQDFFTNEGPLDGKATAFGTGYRFGKDDTLEVSLYTLAEEFYRYLETAEAAQSANGNPFGQPAVIKSNVTNGTGIFTMLPYDRMVYIIP
ncbi:MAG: DUF4249 domain-containing protein [Bacteroidia bacterium]